MATSTWRPVADSSDTEFGVRYRTSVPLARWCWGAVNLGAIASAFRIGSRLADGRIKLHQLEIFPPGDTPSDWRERGYKAEDWGVRVTWEKVGGGTPVLVFAAAIAGVLAIATLSWVVIAKFTEREFREFNEEARDTIDRFKDFLKDTLFNPGVIVSAVVAIALFTRRRR